MLRRTLLLMICASGAAFHVPHATPLRPARAPALRSTPASASALTSVGAGLFVGAGALAWVSPATNLKNYGIPDAEESSATGMMRITGAWQLCLAAVLMAGKNGVTYATGFGLFAAALTNMAVLPTWETFERSKGSMVGACVLFSALGKFALVGAVSPYVAAAIYLILGLLIHFTPKETAELYGVTKPISALGYSMLAFSGAAMSMSGIYLAGLAYGLTQLQSFAAVFVANALYSLKWALTEAADLGAPKIGAIAWSVISAVLTALALK